MEYLLFKDFICVILKIEQSKTIFEKTEKNYILSFKLNSFHFKFMNSFLILFFPHILGFFS